MVLIFAAFTVLALFAFAWAVRALIEGRFFPPQRRRLIPWTGIELVALVFFVQFLLPNVIYEVVERTELLDRIYGVGAEAAPAETKDEGPEKALWKARRSLWLAAIAFPFQVASIIGLLRLASGTRPYQLGLTTWRFGQNVLLGVLAWLAFAPAVYGLNLVINLLSRWVLQQPEEEHPLLRVLRFQPLPFEVVLIGFTAVVAAPIVEELLFRGVLQPWLAKRDWGGLAALALAFALALLQRWTKMREGMRADGLLGAARESWAMLFVVLLIPGYFLARHLGGLLSARRWVRGTTPKVEPGWEAHRQNDHVQAAPRIHGTTASLTAPENVKLELSKPRLTILSPKHWGANWAGAIYATSVLFAAAHSFAWPTPIALFLLALGLGYLAYRTQSLVGPMLMHALFNGVSFALFLVLAPYVEKGKEVTSAVPLTPPISKSIPVPGS